MKKIMIIGALLVFMSVSSSFAVTVTSSGTGFLDLSTAGSLTSGMTDPIGLSPSVEAFYVTTGTDKTDSQWFAISTGHPGGNTAYGTAQNLNNLYDKAFKTGTDDIATVLSGIPQTRASDAVWDTWAAGE